MTTQLSPIGLPACPTHVEFPALASIDAASALTADIIAGCGSYGNRAIIGIMSHTFTSYPPRIECCAAGRFAIYLAAAAWRTALQGESS